MDTVNIEKYTPDWIRELYGIKAPTNAKALNNKTGQTSAPAQTNTKAVNMFEGPPKLPVDMLNSLKTSAMAYAPALPGGLALSG